MSQELKVLREGTRDQASRDWRVRWDSRIANSPARLLKVVDAEVTFDIINKVEVTRRRRGEPDLRRRFLDLDQWKSHAGAVGAIAFGEVIACKP